MNTKPSEFQIESFISQYVIKRSKSMFADDIGKYDEQLRKRINEKSVLVIGGAGSIGSSFIKSILNYHPAELVVVDINENALAELTRDLRSTKGMFIPEKYITYPMDFSSSVFKKMFINHGGFDIVANFSAHKHVRSEKDIFSVEALLQNNVLNARLLMELLSDWPPEVFFCVSTDKAANPVNIMGASKRIMEDVIFSYSDAFPVKTARFANVAFSNGSLPAGFLARLQKLQPLSAPSDVKRYFVSPEESGQICMLSCMLGSNREIFFPKLDQAQMMRFDEIAVKLLETYGYEICYCESDLEALEKAEELKSGSRNYPVHFSVSDTTGEKGYEEFITDNEITDMNRFESLGVIINKSIPDKEKLNKLLDQLESVVSRTDENKEEIVKLLTDYLPDFVHKETGKSLDQKM